MIDEAESWMTGTELGYLTNGIISGMVWFKYFLMLVFFIINLLPTMFVLALTGLIHTPGIIFGVQV